MHIRQVSYQDVLGGAERVALEIHSGLKRDGHNSALYVGKKNSNDSTIEEINPDTDNNAWTQFYIDQARKLEKRKKNSITHYSSKVLRALARPAEFLRWWRGEEEFDFVKTRQLIEQKNSTPDLLHLHNLHGRYFDLRLLPQLCRQQPVIVTLHDEWMYTGHCSYAANCERWQQECGKCPDLESYPAIRVDNTKNNLIVKRSIYDDSRFYLTTPSKWLMDRAKNSVLAESIIDCKVIQNGVDVTVFKQGDRNSARQRLKVPVDAFVGLFIANHFKTGRFKDFKTIKDAMLKLASRNKNKKFLLIAIGEDLGTRHLENLEIKTLPFLHDRLLTAEYYQAADVYLHAAWAEVWGLTITEAMACGIPVVATATGGIPEQVTSLSVAGIAERNGHGIENATGILVEQGNSEQMCQAISILVDDVPTMRKLGENALETAHEKYSTTSMLRNYLEWYSTILETSSAKKPYVLKK